MFRLAADFIPRPRAATSKARRLHAQVRSRSPSHPAATRGRPTAHLGVTPTQRTLVAALKSRTAHPRAANSRMIRVTALQFAPAGGPTVSRGNAAPREEREFAALTPAWRRSQPPVDDESGANVAYCPLGVPPSTTTFYDSGRMSG